MSKKIVTFAFIFLGNYLVSQTVFDEKFIHSSLSAKDYVLSKFKDHDIVVLSERNHRDTTQYNLILEILSDPYFIENVGVIATEVGVKNIAKSINEFTSSTFKTEQEIRDSLKKVYRQTDYFPLWEKHNYYQLIRGIYDINQNINAKNKIKMYPMELEFSWNNYRTSEQYAAAIMPFWSGGGKDSLMARYLVELFEQKKLPKQKILVIMNTPHSFDSDELAGGTTFYTYAKKDFGNRVCNLYLNSQIEWNDFIFMDALLMKHNVFSLGFDLKGTSIGKMDYVWRRREYVKHPQSFETYFDGFVYYQYPLEWSCFTGVPEVIDEDFLDELCRRDTISTQVFYEIRKKRNPDTPEPPRYSMEELRERQRENFEYIDREHCLEKDSIKQQYEIKLEKQLTKK